MPETVVWYRPLLSCPGDPSPGERDYRGGHTLTLGQKNMGYLFQARVSLVSKQKEVSTTNAAKKAKFFCNSIIAYSRSFKIQRVLQLFTLFGKENEQMYITDVIGLRSKVNKRCCF